MNLTYLIQTLQNKITTLNNAKVQAFSMGDINMVESIEKDLIDTQSTFSQLTMLVSLNQAAENANSTPAEVVAIGLDAVQNEVQGPSASAVVNGYDISAYATDPLHEQKIQTIVNAIPALTLVSDIDTYIQSKVEGSPVTGSMILSSAGKFNVNIPLLIAIMQNDSSFGTLGVGARTFNPGNVGNTGLKEVNFGSWEAGVDAVAEWLASHRIYLPSELVVPQALVDEPVLTDGDVPPEEESETVSDSEPETVSEPEVVQPPAPAPVPEPVAPIAPPPAAPVVPPVVPEETNIINTTGTSTNATSTPSFVVETPIAETASTTNAMATTTIDITTATTTTAITTSAGGEVASSSLDVIPVELTTTTPPPLVPSDTSTTTATSTNN